jgi:hypothetical protein
LLILKDIAASFVVPFIFSKFRPQNASNQLIRRRIAPLGLFSKFCAHLLHSIRVKCVGFVLVCSHPFALGSGPLAKLACFSGLDSPVAGRLGGGQSAGVEQAANWRGKLAATPPKLTHYVPSCTAADREVSCSSVLSQKKVDKIPAGADPLGLRWGPMFQVLARRPERSAPANRTAI